MSEFWMEAHSSIVFPFSHSVAYDELAIAEPHPNVCEERRGETCGASAAREGRG